jgi:hypothetical protein
MNAILLKPLCGDSGHGGLRKLALERAKLNHFRTCMRMKIMYKVLYRVCILILLRFPYPYSAFRKLVTTSMKA